MDEQKGARSWPSLVSLRRQRVLGSVLLTPPSSPRLFARRGCDTPGARRGSPELPIVVMSGDVRSNHGGSGQGRTGATDMRETRSALTGSAENQSCSLPRQTQCCDDERIDDMGRMPICLAAVGTRCAPTRTSDTSWGNSFSTRCRSLSARCRVASPVGDVPAGGLFCWQQQRQFAPHGHRDGTLETAPSSCRP